jgi:hypothetical protein
MFGRRKSDDEDPFAALKDGGTYQSSPMTVPDIGVGLGDSQGAQAATQAQAASQAQAAPSIQTTGQTTMPTMTAPQTSGFGSVSSYGGAIRTRRSGFGAVRLVVVLIVIAAVAIPVLSITKSVHSVSIPSFNFGSSTTAPATSAPSAPHHVSYLTPAGVRAGIAHLRRVVPGARVVLFRIDAKSLSATAVGRHGAKEVYFGPTGSLVSSAPATGERPVPISQVRPAVVATLIAQMNRRFHVPPRRIDYMVISSPPGLPTQWIVFSKAPSHPGFAATLTGAGLHRL